MSLILRRTEFKPLSGYTHTTEAATDAVAENLAGGKRYRVVAKGGDAYLLLGAAAGTTSADAAAMPLTQDIPEVFAFGQAGATIALHVWAAGVVKVHFTPLETADV